MAHILTIKEIVQRTHDVKSFTLEKPENFDFKPGQAAEMSVNKDSWRDEKRPFTFTSLPEDNYLEFTIKIYPNHDGVTNQIDKLQVGDSVIVNEPWGTIEYKSAGVFIAGGVGITPFISIFRDLFKSKEITGNKLIFSNKTENDVILKEEFETMLGNRFLNVITDEQPNGDALYLDGFIDKEFLRSNINDFDQPFYVCGPEPFNKAIIGALKELGANPDALIFEK